MISFTGYLGATAWRIFLGRRRSSRTTLSASDNNCSAVSQIVVDETAERKAEEREHVRHAALVDAIRHAKGRDYAFAVQF